MLKIFIHSKLILNKNELTILQYLHTIFVPNIEVPFTLVLNIYSILYNIINSSTFKLKFHKTILNIKQKCEKTFMKTTSLNAYENKQNKTFMKTTLFNAYESQLHGKPHD